ncbi:MAG: hypothetical protein ABI442_13840 [Gemmatimonadaceae bacterium]
MPFSYSIDSSRRLLLTKAWGILSDADILAGAAEVRGDPGFDPTYSEIMDLCDVADIAMSPSIMAGIAGRSIFKPGVRRAFVTQNEMQFGMARMFATFGASRGHQWRVFRSTEDALLWLNE